MFVLVTGCAVERPIEGARTKLRAGKRVLRTGVRERPDDRAPQSPRQVATVCSSTDIGLTLEMTLGSGVDCSFNTDGRDTLTGRGCMNYCSEPTTVTVVATWCCFLLEVFRHIDYPVEIVQERRTATYFRIPPSYCQATVSLRISLPPASISFVLPSCSGKQNTTPVPT